MYSSAICSSYERYIKTKILFTSSEFWPDMVVVIDLTIIFMQDSSNSNTKIEMKEQFRAKFSSILFVEKCIRLKDVF